MSTLPFGSGPSKLLEVSWAFCHLLGSRGRRGASELGRQGTLEGQRLPQGALRAVGSHEPL